MREIKFRAWDKQFETMIYPTPVLSEFYMTTSGRIIDIGHGGVEIELSGRFVLQQYTGLKDKNGKEIYEGDVIQLTANAYKDLELKRKLARKGHRSEVIYQEGEFVWYEGNFFYGLNQLIPKTCDTEIRYMFLDAINCDQKGITCEIIGNIYENPELLKTVDNSKG